MSRCHRKMVPGVTISRIAARRPAGRVPASRASHPVSPRQQGARPRPLALGDSDLVPQHQDLGVLPPRLPPRQAQQRHHARDNQEDQLQPKPKIIPPRLGQDLPADRRTQTKPTRAPQGICPGGTSCRLFAFDPRREAIVLVAGDKAGNWDGWYRKAVPLADQRFAEHLRALEAKEANKQ